MQALGQIWTLDDEGSCMSGPRLQGGLFHRLVYLAGVEDHVMAGHHACKDSRHASTGLQLGSIWWQQMVQCRVPADGHLLHMQEANSTATDLALLLYKDYVRRWLLKLHGYECQEAEGEFMLAFFSPVPAIQFCLQVGFCRPSSMARLMHACARDMQAWCHARTGSQECSLPMQLP